MAILEDLQDDLSNLNDIVRAYNSALDADFKNEISLFKKTIEFCNQEQPSHYSYYDQIRVETESLYELLEIKCREVKAKAINIILRDASKSYGERIIEKMIEDNPKFIEIQKKCLTCKELYLKARSRVESFEQRGYALNNITKLRVAAVSESFVYDK